MSRFRNWRGSRSNTNTTDADPTNEADVSTSEYARRCKELMDLERELRTMGAGGLIDLPSIVVIGGQSAGKSSLVEAISGINVPRESGTCTRCPMECSLSSSADSWSCTISLRFDYDNSGNPLPRGPTSHPFGLPFNDKTQFEISLRRAQAAILNPHLPHDRLLRMTAQELKGTAQWDPQPLKFSKNKVIVDIADPEATNLSFVDLPGLIQNEEQEVIDIIRDLVKQYISRERALILVTIPMCDDMQNQQAVLLAREADPDGKRTIGVLTKPDTLTQGAISALEGWKQVLEGQLYPLKHGYYCVRLPDDAQRSRNLTRVSLQQLASEFFDNTPPWSGITDRHRLGIPGFLSDISKLLMVLIEQALPGMRQDVDRLLAECDEGLRKLPATITDDFRTEILSRITKFCAAFEGAVYGRSQAKGLVQANRAHYDTFEANIHLTAPIFVPSTGLSVTASDTTGTNPLNLHDVRKVIKNSITWELPRNVPFEAKQGLILEFVDRWRQPSLSCFDAVFSTLSDFIKTLVKEHFGRFKQLESHIGPLVCAEIDSCKVLALRAVDKALEREKTPLFTGDDDDYNSAAEKWLNDYKLEKHRPSGIVRPSGVFVSAITEESRRASAALAALAAIGYTGLTIGDLLRLQPHDDEFEDELVVMADVRGYFQVAHKRIVHSIPMTIEHSLTQPLAHTLQQSLLNNIFAETNTTERMRSLLSEEPEIARTRERLESKKAILLNIRERLNY